MSDRFEEGMNKELQFHLDQATADYIAQGLSPEDARRRARTDFGAVDLAKEELRDTRLSLGRRAVDALVSDLRQSLRNFRRAPGFAAITIGMLALGLGINSAVFTVVDAALFGGYAHVQESDRLVQIRTNNSTLYYPDFRTWQSEAKSLEGMALVRGVFHTLGGNALTPESLFTTEISSGAFGMLGVRPLLGRDFTVEDERAGAEPVLILRHDIWSSRFGANPAIIGQRVVLSGRAATVIGVMPEGFSFPWGQSLWTPLIPSPAALARQTAYARYAIGRLQPGVSMKTAQVELDTIAAHLSEAYPATNKNLRPILSGFEDWYIGQRNRSLYRMTWAAVLFLLVIICANVANLFVGQAISRSREIAVRLTLGSGRWRIYRQLLMEGLMLAGLGGLGGLILAWTFLRIYPTVEVSEVILGLSLNTRTVVYLALISAAAGLASSLGAAAYLTRLNALGAPQSGRNSTEGHRARRVSNALVAIETICAIMLLAGAAVLGRSFFNVKQANLGVDTHRILHVDAYAQQPRFPSRTARRAFYRDLLRRLSSIPGVESAAYGDIPPNNGVPHRYQLSELPPGPDSALPSVAVLYTGPGYFRTLGARLLSGRDFSDADVDTDSPVAIVNQRFADQHWHGQSPIGKSLRVLPAFPGEGDRSRVRVVGLVSNVVHNDRTLQDFPPLIYVPGGDSQALLRTSVAPSAVVSAVKREIYSVAPDIPAPIWPLDELIAENYAFERDVTLLFLVFAVVALTVACVGIFAALSRLVARRTQEFGIRVAIGAKPHDILLLTLHEGLWPVVLGLVIGVVASVGVNRLLQSFLVGVTPTDPLALAGSMLLLLAAASLGCFLPARRAARIDPAAALRHE